MRIFFLLFWLLFSLSSLWARTDMTGYGEELEQKMEGATQKITQMTEEMLRAIEALLGQSFDPKNPQQWSKDIFAKLKITPPKEEDFSLDEILEEREVFVRLAFKYEVERHEIWHQEEEDILLDYQDDYSVERNFYGILQKVFNKSRKVPDEYHFHLDSTESENPNGKVRFYRKGKSIPKNPERKPDEWHCSSDQWEVETGSVQFDPLFEKTVPESQAQHYILFFEPGVSPSAQARCTGSAFTEASFLGPHAVILNAEDVERFYKEGFLSKTVSSRHPVEFLSPENLDLNVWLAMPKETLIGQDIRRGNKYGRTEARFEFFLEPRIEGPHFIALPMQTADPQANAQANAVTLKVLDIPSWQTSEIKPMGGWTNALKVVAKQDETGPPGPTLTLVPFAPGKVKFEIEWTSPKGKKGRSKPFEVTVAELRFVKPKKCSGFDEKYEEEHNIPAMSNCVGWTSYTDLTAKPAGLTVKTRLQPADPNAFSVEPSAGNSFPLRLTLTGGRKARETKLTASIEIEEDKWQKAAEAVVDVLEKRDIKILPVNLKTDPLDIWDDTADELEKTEEILIQTCIGIEGLPAETIRVEDVPLYKDGNTVIYNSMTEYGPSWQHLEAEAATEFGQERELTAIFVPHIGTELWNNAQSRSVKLDDPLGFQHKNFIFISQASLWDPTLIAHEIGHYLYGDLYARTEFPGAVHTQDPSMVMYGPAGSGCEIRRKEWLECFEKCPRSAR